MIFCTVRKVSYYICLSALPAQAGGFSFRAITDFWKLLPIYLTHEIKQFIVG